MEEERDRAMTMTSVYIPAPQDIKQYTKRSESQGPDDGETGGSNINRSATRSVSVTSRSVRQSFGEEN